MLCPCEALVSRGGGIRWGGRKTGVGRQRRPNIGSVRDNIVVVHTRAHRDIALHNENEAQK